MSDAIPVAGQIDVASFIATLAELRKQHKAALAEVERIEDEQNKAKLRMRQVLEALGIKEARNDSHSAGLTEKVVPQVVNWDEFWAYIHENKYYHLLQRRPSTTGCEELFAQGVEIPGVEKFRKVDISLRSIS